MLYVGNKIPKQVAVGGAMLRLCSTVRVLSGRLIGTAQSTRTRLGRMCTTGGSTGCV